jgi:hypothetical protein
MNIERKIKHNFMNKKKIYRAQHKEEALEKAANIIIKNRINEGFTKIV